MGFFRDNLFARFLEWAMSGEQFVRERRQGLAAASGEVLEVGFGTGLNLDHYPSTVTRLTAVDPAGMLPKLVARRIAAAPFRVERVRGSAEDLPFHNGRFDCVVSTWTLCSIPDPLQALKEVGRVLRPAGSFFFLEHGRSDDAVVARRQDFFNPIWRPIAGGCNINRGIDQLIRQAGLRIKSVERYVLPGEPRIFAEMYRGVAAPT